MNHDDSCIYVTLSAKEVRQQEAYRQMRGAFKTICTTSPPLIVCLYLAYSKLLKLMEASNAGVYEEEAQLSRKDHASLRVIEYFAKSLKVIRNDTVV